MPALVPTITSEGQPLDPDVRVHSIEVRKELGRIPEARLVLYDGSVADRAFKVSNTAFFEPGKQIRVTLREGDDPPKQLFLGLVVRHTVQAEANRMELRVELRDAAIALTRQRKGVIHRDQRDGDIVRKLARAARLRLGRIDATRVRHREIVQFQATDWDFLLSRADVNGQVVIVDDGVLSMRSMTARAAGAAVRLQFGFDIIEELELELDGGEQWARVTGTAWDQGRQMRQGPVEGAQVPATAGNLEARRFAAKIGGDANALVVPVPLAPGELAALTSARMARSRLAMLRGRIVVKGRADIKSFDRVALDGVGERFNGKVLVSGVIQRVDPDGWRTELVIGLSPECFARTPNIADLPASGLVPPVQGLQLGVVDGFERDPQGDFRVKVRLPALDRQDDSVWARMATPDAGDQRGFSFWPERGDEVVVGFLGGDPRHAIVLGSLFAGKHRPPQPTTGPSVRNDHRAIVSRAGTTIAFDDLRGSLTLKTRLGNHIEIDDSTASILIKDVQGNTITMSADGIAMVSASNFTIAASGVVTISGALVDIL